jgi:hypothetical protein
MATDKLIYEYATHFTKAFAKFIGIEGGDYEAKSITRFFLKNRIFVPPRFSISNLMQRRR